VRKRKTLLDRVRAMEKEFENFKGIVPYMKDAILMMKVLMEKGIVTQEEIKDEYQKLKK
jgi:hypothetical protein